MSENRDVLTYRPIDCDLAEVDEDEGGMVAVGFTLPGPYDIVIEMTPKALASLEAMLERIREKLAARHPPQ